MPVQADFYQARGIFQGTATVTWTWQMADLDRFMGYAASYHFGAPHPLAGLETWPKTGPIYGIADREDALSVVTLLDRIARRIRKSPDGDEFNAGQARIWY